MILSRRDAATVKRVAGIVYPIIEKKDKLQKKVDELKRQIKECDEDIERFESGIKVILGYGIVDLVDKVKVGNSYKYVIKQDVVEQDQANEDEARDGAIRYIQDEEQQSLFEEHQENNNIF